MLTSWCISLCWLCLAFTWRTVQVQCEPTQVTLNSDVMDVTDLIVKKYSNNGNNTHEHFLTVTQLDSLLRALRLGNHIAASSHYGDGDDINESERLNCSSPSTSTSASTSVQRYICNVTQECLTGRQLLQWLDPLKLVSDHSTVDKIALVQLCPLLLTQIEQGTCTTERNNDQNDKDNSKPTHLEVWGYGILFVTVISLCSLVGVAVLPVMGKKLYQRLLTFLIGLAVGSLMGSAVFHLIPQAFNLIPEDNSDHDYLWISLVIMGGVYLFFMTECLMKILLESRKRQLKRLKRNYSDVDTLRNMPATISEEYHSSVGDMSSNLSLHKQISDARATPNPVENGAPPAVARMEKVSDGDITLTHLAKAHKHEHHIEFKPGQDSAIATVAWMIIFGDGLHNFIDGLSIGTAFNENILTGVSISVAVLCEEFPHELGDFAVLLNAGMTMKQALLYNFLSACTCYLGLVVGIVLGELTAASTYIFALAGGMFLYISLVDMIPEMNETLTTASQQSVSKALNILLLQNLGWMSGVAALFTLAYFNKDIKFD